MSRASFILVLFLVAVATATAQEAQAPSAPPEEKSAPGETTLADQTNVEVTVYNNNRALVRDRRKVQMPSGELTLKFMDVAEQILPETVSLKSLNEPGRLKILEQNYEYDLMSPAKLLEKYVGKEVRLVSQDTKLNFEEVNAKLLSINRVSPNDEVSKYRGGRSQWAWGGPDPIYQIGKDIYLGHPGTVVLPEVPKDLIAKPTLIWMLSNEAAGHELEATYLTRGLTWKADYVLTLSQDEKSLSVEGWVTLDNQSGAAYQNAQLKLVAGEVNVVPTPMNTNMYFGAGFGGAMPAPPEMREETLGEYHLYALPRRTTIKDNQSKQVRLLTAEGVGASKAYEYRGDVSFYSQATPAVKEEKVGVVLNFRNDEQNKLGVPLPGGVMRVYQEDSDGTLQFTGEDGVKHTPKDEDVRLRIGNAFDLIGERVQANYEVVAPGVCKVQFEITLRNHKEAEVVIDVVEPMPGDWEILESSLPHEKKDARTAVFHVAVPKNGETKLKYSVQARFSYSPMPASDDVGQRPFPAPPRPLHR